MSRHEGPSQPLHDFHLETRAVRAGLNRSSFNETSEFLAVNSGYVYKNAQQNADVFAGESDHYNYHRVANPTTDMFAARLAELEEAQYCLPVSSGMAAIFYCVLGCVKSGDRIVSSRDVFGSTKVQLTMMQERFGVEVEFVDSNNLDSWEQALAKPAAMVFTETPSNPMMRLVDMVKVSEMCRNAGAVFVVDNTFATPVNQRPLLLGADLVIHSTTKQIDGQGRTMGGAILGNKDFIEENIRTWVKVTGPTMSAFSGWMALKGLETLPLRVRAAGSSALRLARTLQNHDAVQAVYHPGLTSHPQYELAKAQMYGFGTVLSIELQDKKAAFSLLDNLNIIDISNNLGDTKTMAVHCATTTHSALSEEDRAKAGITDGIVRISVGLEEVSDLYDDIAQSLDA